MILQDARCTNCGASISLSSDEVSAKCQYCQTQLVLEQAIAFSKVEVDRSKEIVKLRQGLLQTIPLDSLNLYKTSFMFERIADNIVAID